MSTGKVIGDGAQYRVGALIANGAFSEVYHCTSLADGAAYAVKVTKRKLAESSHMTQALIREVNAMEVAGQSPYVVSLVDKLVSSNNYYIIMDLAEGGTLQKFIKDRHKSKNDIDGDTVEVEWARPYVKQLLLGISSLHQHNVVHRDIKPENILLNSSRTRLLLSDFGFACYAPPGRILHRGCGTLRYSAPEILVEQPAYDGRKVDIWAAGVTLFAMLFGRHPFLSGRVTDPDVVLGTILHNKLRLRGSCAHPLLTDFFRSMLEVDPSKRSSADQLLRHPWLSNCSTSPLERSALSPAFRKRGNIAATDSAGIHTDDAAFCCEDCDEQENSVGEDSFFYNQSQHSVAQTASVDLDELSRNSLATISSLSGAAPEFLGSPNAQSTSNASMHSLSGVSSLQDGKEARLREPSSLFSSFSGVPDGDGDDTSVPTRVSRLRDFCLTVAVFCNLALFFVALLTASALRILFNMRVSDLPVPQRIISWMEYLLVPPHERAVFVRRTRRPTLDRETPEGQQANSQRTTPGHALRRYFRKAERYLTASNSKWLREGIPHQEDTLDVHRTPMNKASEVSAKTMDGNARLDSPACTLRRRANQGMRLKQLPPPGGLTMMGHDSPATGRFFSPSAPFPACSSQSEYPNKEDFPVQREDHNHSKASLPS